VAKSLDRRASRLTASAVSGPTSHERKYRVKFPTPPASGRIVLEATDLAKSYGGPPVFRDVSFAVERGQRLLIMGLNGAGKTSLLRILASTSDPSSGAWRTGLNVSAGYYAQEHEGIRPGVAVLDHMRSSSPIAERELRALLGMFGLYGDVAFQDASTLSGGEKTKLALAQLVAGNHNLLLLDEPTNNLDPPSRTAIGQALADWPGTMIVVSHDAEFVTELAPDRVLLMPDGTEDAWSDDLLDLVAMA
jgi:ATPase subunit of ABC transporter with duplicated ATPase domains